MRAGKHRGSLDWEGGHRCSTGTKEALGEGQQRHAGVVWEHSPCSAHLLHLSGSILPAQHTGTSLTGAAAGRWGQEGHGQRAARGRTCKQDGGCARTARRRRRGTGPAQEVPGGDSWLVGRAHLQAGQRFAETQLHKVHVVLPPHATPQAAGQAHTWSPAGIPAHQSCDTYEGTGSGGGRESPVRINLNGGALTFASPGNVKAAARHPVGRLGHKFPHNAREDASRQEGECQLQVSERAGRGRGAQARRHQLSSVRVGWNRGKWAEGCRALLRRTCSCNLRSRT